MIASIAIRKTAPVMGITRNTPPFMFRNRSVL